MIRQVQAKDKTVFIDLMKEFYRSDAVLHQIAEANYYGTFFEVTSDSPYAIAFLIEKDGQIAGYALLAFTYSNEAGGLVLWLDELYIRPAFQGQGLGSELFAFIDEQYKDRVARMRLEIEPDNEGAARLYRRQGYETLPYVQMVKDMTPEAADKREAQDK